MSYIRSTSNPEGLYVFTSKEGVTLAHSVKPPLASTWPKNGSNPVMIIPERLFLSVCKTWNRTYACNGVSRRGLKIREVHVFVKTGKRVQRLTAKSIMMPSGSSEFFIRIDYKGKFVHLWRVTWDSVVRSASIDWDV